MRNAPDDQQRDRTQQPDDDRSSAHFGWRPGEPPEQFHGTDVNRADDAEPAPFTGPSLLTPPADSGAAYWTPQGPEDLPSTIVRRQPQATGQDLMQRYRKPALLAAGVAAVSTAGLSPAVQPATAQGVDSAEHLERAAEDLRQAPDSSSDVTFVNDAEPDTAQPSQERTEATTYTVREGDELRSIAREFGLQTMTIVWNNDISDPALIRPGQQLLIPPADGVLVEVQAGDMLRNLATTYGTSTTAIINFEPNGISDPEMIHPGQQLMIPGGVPPDTSGADENAAETQSLPAEQSTAGDVESASNDQASTTNETGEEVTVQSGDTLANIAQRFGVTINELASANQIEDIDLIYSGTTLEIPDSEAPETASEPDAQVSTEPEPEPTPEPEPDPEPEPEPTATQEPTSTPEPEPTQTPEPEPEPETDDSQSGTPSDIPGLLDHFGNQYGIDPNLVKAVAWLESGWQQDARNPSGATGVMQIMPATGRSIANNIIGQPLDISGSASDNIQAGASYLRYLIDSTGGVERGLASYLQGPVHVQRNGIDETGRGYVDRVMEIRDYIAENGEPPNWR